jgi:NADH:ubiquinone oxidoreductase subunit C
MQDVRMEIKLIEDNIVSKITETLGSKRIKRIDSPRERRVNLEVDRSELNDVALILKNEGFYHLSTITVQEESDALELIYHISNGGDVINLRLSLPLNDLILPTLTNVYLCALLYEQEVNEFTGVEFKGHPSMDRLILPEQWPKGSYPLRKKQTEEPSSEETHN